VVEFPWGRASDPAGVAPEPLEEFLTSSRVISPNCNIPGVTVTKNGSCHHEHCKAYLLSTLVCINLKQVYFDCLSLGR